MEEILHQLLYEFLPSFAMMYLGVEVQQDRSFLIPTSELKPEKHLERTHQLVGPGYQKSKLHWEWSSYHIE